MHVDFSGRVALVTGAAGGIGSAVVRGLRDAGAVVAAADLDPGAVDGAVHGDADQTGVRAFRLDVRDSEEVEATVARVERELGPVHVLVNVAGTLRAGPATELSDADWAEVFAVNTAGVFHVSRAVTRRMLPRRSGVVVTVASNAARVPRVSMAAYAASKAATVMFTKCLGLELAEHGIRCNIVSPGSTDTAMQRALWADDSGARSAVEGSLAAYRVGVPLHRLGQPRHVADAVCFLASDDAEHITMQDLCVDGGAALGA